jgi:hypothetical protein
MTYMNDSDDQGLTSAFKNHMQAQYTIVEAEDNASPTRSLARNGHSGEDRYAAPKEEAGQYVFLDDFWYSRERRDMDINPFDYKPKLYMWIFPESSALPADTVAVFNFWAKNPGDTGSIGRHGGVVMPAAIPAGQFDGTDPDTIAFQSFPLPSFYLNTSYNPLILDTLNPDEDWMIITHQIVSTGICSLAVNSYNFSNEQGRNFRNAGVNDQKFTQHCNDSRCRTRSTAGICGAISNKTR